MDAHTAQIVYFAIMGVGLVVWAWSLNRAASLGKGGEPKVDPWASPYTDFPMDTAYPSEAAHRPDRANYGNVSGQRTVNGQPERLSKALARALLNTTVPGRFSTVFEVDECTAERVRVRKTGPLVCREQSGLHFSEAEFTFERVGDQSVLISYQLEFEGLLKRVRRTALAFILGLGLPILIVVGAIIWFLVVQSDNPTVRWQVFQTLHIAHVLWPPFQILHSYRSGRTQTRTYVSNMLAMLDPEPTVDNETPNHSGQLALS